MELVEQNPRIPMEEDRLVERCALELLEWTLRGIQKPLMSP